jgi:hypothetical protein
VALLGLTLALVTVSAGHASAGHAVAAKKRCKRKRKKSAAVAKKKCKKKRTVAPPVTVPALPAPTPKALSNPEILDRVAAKALEYGQEDPDFNDNIGYFYDDTAGTVPHCRVRSELSASCEGYWEWDDGVNHGECDFYEVVERDGLTGIKSHLDTDYDVDGFTDGVDCRTAV